MCLEEKKKRDGAAKRDARERKDVIQKEKPRQIIISFFFFVFVGFGKNVRDENVVKKKTYRKEKKRGSLPRALRHLLVWICLSSALPVVAKV